MPLTSIGNGNLNRWKHFTAMALIGDGVIGLIRPGRDAQAWEQGPAPWRKLMGALSRRPALTRVLAAAEIAGGVYWILSREAPKQSA